MTHSDKAIRQQMRRRGIKTDAAHMERVTREVNSTERERALRQEAARAMGAGGLRTLGGVNAGEAAVARMRERLRADDPRG